MKIYTFHKQIEAGFDDPILWKLWKESWTKRGFEPHILGLAEARAHPRYQEVMNAQALFVGHIGLIQYIQACYERWLAFAHVASKSEEPTLTGDWDVINYFLSPDDILKIGAGPKIKHLSGSATPCLVYGTAAQYDAAVALFLEYAARPHRNTPALRDSVSDQNIFDAYNNRWELVTLVTEYPQPGWDKSPAVHYPHGRLYLPGHRGQKIHELRAI